MRVIFDGIREEEKRWNIEWHEEPENGKPIQRRLLSIPVDTIEWRAAEYNITPDRLDDLIDLIFCEQFIPESFYQSDKGLFRSPDIETARTAYLSEIARIKWERRISTRGTGHILNQIRAATAFDAGQMAYKGMTVLLNRQLMGAQILDPAVHTVLMNFAAAHPNVVREG